jgi:carbon-monoxide dehydrogenase large subunit
MTTVHSPIGQPERRQKARRLVVGNGRYTDDLAPQRALHAAFLRSPFAHARIQSIETGEAADLPGVEAILTGRDLAEHCAPWKADHAMFADLDSPLQYPMAVDVARWQGEPVVMVLADSRAVAEDAVGLIEVEWEELPAIVDSVADLADGAAILHPDKTSNLALERRLGDDGVEAALAGAALVVEETFTFGRHTGVPLEPRAIIASYEPGEAQLTVQQSHQAPHQQQELYAKLLDLQAHNVRVICDDVGGAFGIKLQFHGDEAAVAVAAKMLGRPVRFTADRLESFTSDVHARDHKVTARMGFDADGRILGLDLDDIFAIGPYSQYPRASVMESSHILQLTAAPYRMPAYRGRARVVYQNKGLMGHYRAVGQPLGCAIGEVMLEQAARTLGLDPVEIRRRNHVQDADCPYPTPAGITLEDLTLDECLDRLVDRMGLPALRAEQARLRDQGIYRGIGIAGFIEQTGPGPNYYGQGGVAVSAQDGCVVRLEPSGVARVFSGATDQGQGADTAAAQVVAASLGIATEDVRVTLGDSEVCPYGGGAFASRGSSIGLEVAYRAGRKLRGQILEIAGALLQISGEDLDLRDGSVVEKATGQARFTLVEIAEIGHFRQYELPQDFQPQMMATEHYVPRDKPTIVGNGIQGSYLEVDVQTGIVTLLDHWVVHDCGFVINPLLLDEQIRGGVVQGMGGALFEEIVYDDQGQMLTATMADYLVPMASEIPDIDITRIEKPMGTETLGAKGVGEAGTAGAVGAILCAINDALVPLDAKITQTPCTPERILKSLK